MTNAEAILRLKDHFAIHDDGRPTPYLDEAAKKAYKALQIADRLEQNRMNVLDRFCKDDCNCEELEDCKRNLDLCASAILWGDGYKQALTDIRGDNE